MGKLVECPGCGHRYRLTNEQLKADAPTEQGSARVASSEPPPSSVPDAVATNELQWPEIVDTGRPTPWAARPKRRIPVIALVAVPATLLTVGAICLLMFTRGSASKVAWATVSSSDGCFSISMPGKHERQTRTEIDPQLGAVVHEIIVGEERSAVFVVDHAEFASDVDPNSLTLFLDTYCNDSIRARSAKIIKQTDIAVRGKLRGREQWDEFPNPDSSSRDRILISKSRVYVDAHRFFAINAIAPKGNSNSVAISNFDRFLQSFHRHDGADPSLNGPPKLVQGEDVAPRDSTALEGPKSAPVPEPAPKFEPPVAVGSGLRYAWEPAKTYVYELDVLVDAGNELKITIKGHALYRAIRSNAEGFTLDYQARIKTTRIAIQDGREICEDMPLDPNATIKMDAKGRVTKLETHRPVPLLGDLCTMILLPFPDNLETFWEVRDFLSLTRYNIYPNPMGWNGPVFRDNARFPPTSPLPSRNIPFITPPQIRPATPRLKLIQVSRATDHVEFRLGETLNDTVPIEKVYTLKTDARVGGEPQTELAGRGTFQFHQKRGIPTALDFQSEATVREPNDVLRVPITAKFRLLEEVDRQKFLNPPLPPNFEPSRNTPIVEARIDQLITALGKTTQDSRVACKVLVDAAPLEGRRSSVARAIELRLSKNEESLRGLLVQTLGTWGDKASVPVLIECMNSEAFGTKAELLDALCRLAPRNPSALVPVLPAWLNRDDVSVQKLYRSLGPMAEAALIKVVEQPGEATGRAKACSILSEIGTKACLPKLQAVGRKSFQSELIRQMAEGAVRSIHDHQLDDRAVAKILTDLAGDNLHKRQACTRLALIPKAAEWEVEIARKLEALLDDHDEQVNVDASHALAVWGNDHSRRALLDYVSNPHNRQWRPAAEDLIKMSRDAETATIIAARIQDDRRAVARLLEKIGPAAEKATILIVETDGRDENRQVACSVLSNIGTARSLPALRKAADEKKFLVSGEAEQTLQAIERRTISAADLTKVLNEVKDSKDVEVRRTAMNRILALDRDPAGSKLMVGVLLATTRDPDPFVQSTAIRAIGKWATAEDVPAFYTRLDEKSFNVRDLGVTLVKIDPSTQTVQEVLRRLDKLDLPVSEVLAEIGAAHEVVVVRFVQSSTSSEVPLAAGPWLNMFATNASIADLAAMASGPPVTQLASSVVQNAVRVIQERERWRDWRPTAFLSRYRDASNCLVGRTCNRCLDWPRCVPYRKGHGAH